MPSRVREATRKDGIITPYDHQQERLFDPAGFVEEQLQNQITTYGKDPAEMRGEERAQYLRDMVLACTEELHEILRTQSWKPWHRGREGYGEPITVAPHYVDVYERDLADEFGDVMCFLGNIARALGLSTADVIAGHRRKLKVNAERHADQAQTQSVGSDR